MTNIEDKCRGYQLIDPGLALPKRGLDDDTQTKCLSLLIDYIVDNALAPDWARFSIIPAQYLGGPWPCIGMYVEAPLRLNADTINITFELEKVLEEHVEQVGIENLVQMASGETILWSDVLRDFDNL